MLYNIVITTVQESVAVEKKKKYLLGVPDNIFYLQKLLSSLKHTHIMISQNELHAVRT